MAPGVGPQPITIGSHMDLAEPAIVEASLPVPAQQPATPIAVATPGRCHTTTKLAIAVVDSPPLSTCSTLAGGAEPAAALPARWSCHLDETSGRYCGRTGAHARANTHAHACTTYMPAAQCIHAALACKQRMHVMPTVCTAHCMHTHLTTSVPCLLVQYLLPRFNNERIPVEVSRGSGPSAKQHCRSTASPFTSIWVELLPR